MSTTLEQLFQMARNELELEDEKIDAQASFTDLGLDSLMLVDFLFSVEDRYGIDIDHDRVLARPTLAGLAALVDELMAERRPLAA
jgi:acyl carrier protein